MADKSTFVYVTLIRTTPEKLWEALTRPEFVREYWEGMGIESEWKKGAPWKLVFSDGEVADGGEVIECEKPHRIVLKWRHEFRPEFKAEGDSLCTFEINPTKDKAVIMLEVTHEMNRPNSRFIVEGVSKGWPMILSSLKSFLETGKPLEFSICE